MGENVGATDDLCWNMTERKFLWVFWVNILGIKLPKASLKKKCVHLENYDYTKFKNTITRVNSNDH